jgi:hypothetical protein
MSNPEQLNAERTQVPLDDAEAQTNGDVIEIEADALEHVAGGCVGGGGVGNFCAGGGGLGGDS